MDITLSGAVDTVHGTAVRVYQDHDGVRIDAGIREYMLDRAAAVMLRDAIRTMVPGTALSRMRTVTAPDTCAG